MKIECPECHVEGHLQRRGGSFRVQHYVGYVEGKRIYCYHKVDGMEVSGSKSMEVKNAVEMTKLKKKWAEPDLNRRPFDYQSNAPAVLSYQPLIFDTNLKYLFIIKNFRKSFNSIDPS